MKEKLKLLLVFFTIVVISTALAGCSKGGGNSNADQSREVELSIYINFGASDTVSAAYQEIANQYMEENPNVKVVLTLGTSGYEQIIKVKLAANDLPDMWSTHGWSVARYSNFLRPLNDQPWFDKINPQILPIITRPDNGNVYVLPFDVDLAGLIVNKGLGEELGLDVLNITTFAELDAVCEKFTNLNIRRSSCFHIGGKDSWTVGNLLDWLAPAFLTVPNHDFGDALKDGTFDWDNYNPILELVSDYTEKGYFNIDISTATTIDTTRAFADGLALFTFNNNGVIEPIKNLNPEADIVFIPIPKVYDDSVPFLIAGERSTLGVWKDTKEMEETLELLSYYARPENVAKIASANSIPAGLIDATSDLGDLTPYFTEYADVYTLSYFDREYLPSGMWDVLCSSTLGVITETLTVQEATDEVEKNYKRLRQQVQ